VTPYLTVRGATAAIEFYRRAFGARLLVRMPGPGDTLMHAEIRIGDSVVYLSDEYPDWGSRGPQSLGGTTGSLHLYVRDVDGAVRRATRAGATVKMPPADMFWGDRYAKLLDPFGHEWGLATPREVLSPRELRKRAAAFAAQMSAKGPGGGGSPA
jgi:uncharacterized glyoxalase superfamily protein PhnB